MISPETTAMLAGSMVADVLSGRSQDNAVARGARNRDVSLFGPFQRIYRAWLDRKRFEVSVGKTGGEFAQHRCRRTRRQCQRVHADIGVPATIEFEDVELHDRIDGRDQDLPAAQAERVLRGLKIG